MNLETPITLSTQTVATAWYVLGAAIQSGSGDHFIQSVVGGGWHYNSALQEGHTDRRWTLSGWDAFPGISGGSGIYHAANLSVAAIPVEPPVFTGTVILIK